MWQPTTIDDLNTTLSSSKPVIIFKHSYRCSISSMALNRIEKIQNKIDKSSELVLVDVIKQRNFSQKIAQELNVEHASPQIIVVQNGTVQYADSHLNIQAAKLLSYL